MIVLSLALIVKVEESVERVAVPEVTSETTGREKAGLRANKIIAPASTILFNPVIFCFLKFIISFPRPKHYNL